MTAEPDIEAELLKVSQAIVTSLASVATAAGPERAALAATILIRLATHHLLTAHGVQAARDALAMVWRDLSEAIAATEPVITPAAII